MLKYPGAVKEERYDLSYRNSTVSEYLSCKIIEAIGFEVQRVLFGMKNGKMLLLALIWKIIIILNLYHYLILG